MRGSLRSSGSSLALLVPITLTPLGFAPEGLLCQTREPSALRALRTVESVDVGSWLNEDAWAEAQRMANFTRRHLNFGIVRW